MNGKTWLGALLGLAFVTCGATASYASPPKDACALLTAAQVSAVLGVRVPAGKLGGPHECGFGNRVLVEIIGPMGTLTPTDRFNTMKMPVPVRGVVKTPVTGVGDDAVSIGIGAAMLAVKKGAFVFTVHVYGFSSAQTKAKEKALALDVLAEL